MGGRHIRAVVGDGAVALLGALPRSPHISQLAYSLHESLVPGGNGMLPFNDQIAGTLAIITTAVLVLGLLWMGSALH